MSISVETVGFETGPEELSPGIYRQPVHPALKVLTSGRQNGNTDPRFSSEELADQSRLRLLGATGCDQLVAMAPLNGDSFIDIDDIATEPAMFATIRNIEGDGLITGRQNIALFLGPADCAPLVLYEPERQVLGLAHIGRTGAALNLAGKMFEYLRDERSADPAKLKAHFGPAIAPESYTMPYLGSDLQTDAWEPFVRQTAAGYEVDFVGFAAKQLIDLDVPAENISTTPVDVRNHAAYFSLTAHKAGERANGRNGFAVAIR